MEVCQFQFSLFSLYAHQFLRTFVWLVFHNPRLVLILTHSLKTLPKTVYKAGVDDWYSQCKKV
ncbi:hypothetical protein K443DRAFT_116355 [Laccaria amethystina LaAM-08-1]|uniref:Uncharacterized protein n=1 Tax=Laccaria amethystina LaAM-08-1 TaxID=1095629 RepID=A0A0C9WRS8_9AGAR|nr:hypothetical protein K443DRAFT_116355 [Laccaria amethystina LaAM-08-1]